MKHVKGQQARGNEQNPKQPDGDEDRVPSLKIAGGLNARKSAVAFGLNPLNSRKRADLFLRLRHGSGQNDDLPNHTVIV